MINSTIEFSVSDFHRLAKTKISSCLTYDTVCDTKCTFLGMAWILYEMDAIPHSDYQSLCNYLEAVETCALEEMIDARHDAEKEAEA